MAYIRDIPKPKCFECGVPAKKEVVNRLNSTVGYFCTYHAKIILDRLNNSGG